MRTNMLKPIWKYAVPVLVCLLIQPALTACSESTNVDVNLHGVNHTVDTFSYSVKNPALKDQPGAGGELIDLGGQPAVRRCPRPGVPVSNCR